MIASFDYLETGDSLFGKIFTPVAQVTFKSPNSEISATVPMIVDTGADFTIIPRYIAHKLDISLEKDCLKETVMGVGGNQTIYFVKTHVEAKIGKVKRKVPLAIFDNNETPALLGRLGFLELFDVLFSKDHKTVFN